MLDLPRANRSDTMHEPPRPTDGGGGAEGGNRTGSRANFTVEKQQGSTPAQSGPAGDGVVVRPLLHRGRALRLLQRVRGREAAVDSGRATDWFRLASVPANAKRPGQIGRASCRERV